MDFNSLQEKEMGVNQIYINRSFEINLYQTSEIIYLTKLFPSVYKKKNIYVVIKCDYKCFKKSIKCIKLQLR